MANNQMELKFPKGGIFVIIVVVALIILFSKSTVTIGPGEGGVIFETLGDGINTEKTYGEGFQIVAPWNRMIIIKVRQQSISDEMNVLSVNGLEVKVNGTIWYEPELANLGLLIKDFANETLFFWPDESSPVLLLKNFFMSKSSEISLIIFFKLLTPYNLP